MERSDRGFGISWNLIFFLPIALPSFSLALIHLPWRSKFFFDLSSSSRFVLAAHSCSTESWREGCQAGRTCSLAVVR